MSPEQFCYWLQGFLEISRQQGIDAVQAQVIKDHLKLVFKKETPEYAPYFNPADFETPKTYCCADKHTILDVPVVVSC